MTYSYSDITKTFTSEKPDDPKLVIKNCLDDDNVQELNRLYGAIEEYGALPLAAIRVFSLVLTAITAFTMIRMDMDIRAEKDILVQFALFAAALLVFIIVSNEHDIKKLKERRLKRTVAEVSCYTTPFGALYGMLKENHSDILYYMQKLYDCCRDIRILEKEENAITRITRYSTFVSVDYVDIMENGDRFEHNIEYNTKWQVQNSSVNDGEYILDLSDLVLRCPLSTPGCRKEPVSDKTKE